MGGGGGSNIIVGIDVKAKVCELEEEVMQEFLRLLRKDFTGVIQ